MLFAYAKHSRCRLLGCLAIVAIVVGLARIPAAHAQEADTGSEMNGPPPLRPPPSDATTSEEVRPLERVPIRQPITGSMMVAPPYGSAPLKVGFFVLATDPENIGFLTYSWNFGDGTVSSLPPELYIFHTYPNPGNYVCSLMIKTVDGRSKSFFQGVIVRDPAG
ncbi:MAG: PKD domain-containing protein [Candidatus Binataceae bacterium]